MSEPYDVEDRADRLELISRLAEHAGTKAAHREIVELKREYEAALGKTLMTGPRDTPLVNQREIDYQRGFYRGLLWGYTVLLKNAGPQLEKLLKKELDERGDAE